MLYASAIRNYFSQPTRYAASGFPGTDKPDGRIGQYLRNEGSSLDIEREPERGLPCHVEALGRRLSPADQRSS